MKSPTASLKARPIIFSPHGVEKMIEGKKTETRRVVKPQPESIEHWAPCSIPTLVRRCDVADRKGLKELGGIDGESYAMPRCPYGRKGDLLYVKEPWRIHAWDCDSTLFDIQFDGGDIQRDVELFRPTFDDLNDNDSPTRVGKIHEQIAEQLKRAGHPFADDDSGRFAPWSDEHPNPLPWKSPLFMSRSASRLTLQVTESRIERLQAIDEGGREAEGLSVGEGVLWNGERMFFDHFRSAWDAMNKKPGSRWEDNPFVWVIKFEEHSTESGEEKC